MTEQEIKQARERCDWVRIRRGPQEVDRCLQDLPRALDEIERLRASLEHIRVAGKKCCREAWTDDLLAKHHEEIAREALRGEE